MAEKDPHVIGSRIARRRHQLRWSQVELARRLGVSPSTVANWERGVSYPSKKLGLVEQVLGITLDDDPVPEPDIVPAGLREHVREIFPDRERAERVEAAIEAALRDERPARGPNGPRENRAAG
jgi:transcriptional regulator with XRE-family HTH domain